MYIEEKKNSSKDFLEAFIRNSIKWEQELAFVIGISLRLKQSIKIDKIRYLISAYSLHQLEGRGY